jgi:hypothetical protein
MKKVHTFADAMKMQRESEITGDYETHESSLQITNTKTKRKMNKKETIKFVVQLIAAIASAILTALGASSCMRL